MSLCSRLLRVVSLACAVVAVSGLAQAQQPAVQPPPAKQPATQTGSADKKLSVPAPKDPVVATVNGQPIYLSELQVAQQALAPQFRSVPLSSVYPALLDKIIDSKLIVADGKKNRIDVDPAFKRRMAFVEEQVIQDFWLQKEFAKRITPDQLQARYQEKLKSMPAEDEVHARHILVATEQEAKDLLAELKKGASFDKLAREKSTDKASGAEGGDLGWFKRTDMVKEFSDAAFALKKGEMSDAPVKTQFGFHLIKVDDRRQAPPPTFDELADQIRDEVQRETWKQYLDQLHANGKIEKFNIDGSKVAAAPASPPAGTPPAATLPGAAPSTTGPTAPPPALPNPAK
jgi:peptidyl-prolyl cis-trans isomerase C